MSPEPRLRRQLGTYPVEIRIPTRFSDMDNYGHINNAVLSQVCDDAIARFNADVFGVAILAGSGSRQLLVAECALHYLAAAFWPADFVVGVGATRVGSSSFGLGLGLFQETTCTTTADITLVHTDGGSSCPIPDDLRARLGDLALTASTEN